MAAPENRIVQFPIKTREEGEVQLTDRVGSTRASVGGQSSPSVAAKNFKVFLENDTIKVVGDGPMTYAVEVDAASRKSATLANKGVIPNSVSKPKGGFKSNEKSSGKLSTSGNMVTRKALTDIHVMEEAQRVEDASNRRKIRKGIIGQKKFMHSKGGPNINGTGNMIQQVRAGKRKMDYVNDDYQIPNHINSFNHHGRHDIESEIMSNTQNSSSRRQFRKNVLQQKRRLQFANKENLPDINHSQSSINSKFQTKSPPLIGTFNKHHDSATSDSTPLPQTQWTDLTNIPSKRNTRIGIHSSGVNLISKFQHTVQLPKPVSGNNDGHNTPLHPTPNGHNNQTVDEELSTNLHFSDSESSHTQFDSESEDDLQTTDQPQSSIDSTLTEYFDIGNPLCQCEECGANMWYQERTPKGRKTSQPKFSLCCGNGKIQVPLLRDPPKLLQDLLFESNTEDNKNYQMHCRIYNSMFAFTSPGLKVDNNPQRNRGLPTIRIQGQACHRIGSLLPKPGQTTKFAQLYIYDTQNEVHNRMACFRDNKDLNTEIVSKLSQMLYEHNVHAKAFKMARDRLMEDHVDDLKLKLISERSTDGRIYNQPTVSEVAALIVGDIDTADYRDIILQTQDGELQRIDEFHASYLGYQYPLIFPYGEDGYRPDIPHKITKTSNDRKRNRVTIKEWLSFRLQSRKNEPPTLLSSRRLFQQFIVDGYAMLESERLNWLRKNQSKLRVGKYDTLQRDPDVNGQKKKGKRVVLPSSFVGGRRYMDQLYFDGMAISSYVGFPDLFITFTCNPNWPEIVRELSHLNLNPQDRPDVITRIFKIKFDELLKDLTRKNVLGKVVAFMYTIEFQKRGLPHAHILIFLHPSSKYPTTDDINKIISAEIPAEQENLQLHNLVKTHMIHGPCGASNLSCPCMKNGRCSKYYPKKFQNKTIVDQDGFPVYMRRDNGHTVDKCGVTLDNRSVVPYNPMLLLKYQAHINMEWCNQCTSIKYLFKYIHKGYDRITATIGPSKRVTNSASEPVDEIKQYLDCRYISPSEACWRIFSFPIHGRQPAIERLFFHLLGGQSVFFKDCQPIGNLLLKPSVTESMFTAWFEANKRYEEGKTLTYGQFVTKFIYNKTTRTWKPRNRGYTIGRLTWVPPSTGELYYLRMILTIAKGPNCYEDLKIVDNYKHKTFREACFALGFLSDDADFITTIKQANDWGSGKFLRNLFVVMLICGDMSRPSYVWEKTRHWLCDGILYDQRKIANNRALTLPEDEIYNLTLIEIEHLLQVRRKSLKDYSPIPYPTGNVSNHRGNKLIYDEKNYNVTEQQQIYQQLSSSLTDEQKGIFEKIIEAINNERGGVFFLHGYGGTGKTFMWNTLASALRSKGQIVIPVASSGIASLLLPGGRTAHSKFKIPVPTLSNSTCNIHYDDELAGLLRLTNLIIWDEAPMCNKFTFECLDRTLRDIMTATRNSDAIFGGKVIVFGGDFRQILPVIPRGSRSDIVHASINSSYIWDHCQVLTLTQNMRLQGSINSSNKDDVAAFAEWILHIGEGKLSEPNDGHAEIEIPKELLLPKSDNPINTIVHSTYPNITSKYNDVEFLQTRAILASRMDIVDEINDFVLDLIPGEARDYYSADSVDRSDVTDLDIYQVLTQEFLSTLKTSGLANHKIRLKIGTPIMLLRNIDQTEGLCNGTRMIVTNMNSHVIQAKIISGKNIGDIHYLPRVNQSPLQSPWPFKLIRRQFPIIVSYAMTINKSQGQSLDHVGLYLPRPVFSHGQLYVAISRVKSKKRLKVLIHDKNNPTSTKTTNVVYKEVFQNVWV